MFGEGSQDAELPYQTEVRKEMFSSVDRLVQEIALKFQQIPKVSENDQYECQIDKIMTTLIKRSSSLREKDLQHFFAVAAAKGGTQMWKEGLLEHLHIVTKYNLGNSTPNIVMMLQLIPSIVVSVVTCERSFFFNKNLSRIM